MEELLSIAPIYNEASLKVLVYLKDGTLDNYFEISDIFVNSDITCIDDKTEIVKRDYENEPGFKIVKELKDEQYDIIIGSPISPDKYLKTNGYMYVNFQSSKEAESFVASCNDIKSVKNNNRNYLIRK
jgi:hypothetical protein